VGAPETNQISSTVGCVDKDRSNNYKIASAYGPKTQLLHKKCNGGKMVTAYRLREYSRKSTAPDFIPEKRLFIRPGFHSPAAYERIYGH